MKFCGFSVSGGKPDATMLERFKDRLMKKGVWGRLLEKVNRVLEKEGLKINSGAAVADATLVPSTRRPGKTFSADSEGNVSGPEHSDDPDAAWVTKAGRTVYGYAAFVATDEDGLVESVEATPANESEMTVFPCRVGAKTEPGRRIVYDEGADSQNNRDACRRAGLKDGIMRRKPKGRKQRRWDKVRSRLLSKRRFVVERAFGTMKRTYGISRAKLIGLEKFATEAPAKAIAYNLRRAANRLAYA